MLPTEIYSARNDVFDFFCQLLKGWPEYVIVEWVYKKFKNDPGSFMKYIQENNINPKEITWRREERIIEYLDFTPLCRKALLKEDKKNPFTKASFAKQINQLKNPVQDDPIIVLEWKSGFELVVGWKGTAQKLRENPEGFTTVLWIGEMKNEVI